MKCSRGDVVSKACEFPVLKFDDQRLTSFAGLVIILKLFWYLNLRKRIQRCFKRGESGKAYTPARLFVLLIVHKLLGFRQLRHLDYYRDTAIA